MTVTSISLVTKRSSMPLISPVLVSFQTSEYWPEVPGLVRTDFQRNAVGGSPPMPALADAQSVEDAAAAIAAAIEHPVAEIYTNPRHAAIVQSYFQDVGAFEQAAAARG